MYDQVVSEGKDIVSTNEPSIVPRQQKKWLNIVLDVNGVLGQCILKFELGRVRRVHEMRDNIFSHMRLQQSLGERRCMLGNT